MKDFDDVIDPREQASMNRLINVLLVFLLIADLMLVFAYYKKMEQQKNEVPTASAEYKESNYTLSELYKMIEDDEVADDAMDIIANWYDYFSKDVVFKNKFGEEYNYNEYMSVKDINLKERFVVTILNTKKNDVLLLLTK